MKAVIGALAAAAVVAFPLEAQVDLAGKWEMKAQTPRGEVTQILTITQDGNAFTGTVEMTGGGGGERGGRRFGGGPMTAEIQGGAIDGNTVTFSIVRGMGDRSFTTRYTGTLSGDTLSGTMTTPRGESEWTAVRVATD